jgi:ribonuclease BN (tRNA processing enzyme)
MTSANCNFRVVNCWSKAGIGTSITVAYGDPKSNGPRIALDLGATPAFEDTIHASVVLLSHGHIDHIGAIFSHARAHGLSCSGSIPTYYLPKDILPLVIAAKEAMTVLNAAGDRDGATLDMHLVGVEPGDELTLPLRKHLKGTELVLRVFPTSHAGCPAVGYVISSRRRLQRLKLEYQGQPGEELRNLARAGVTITDELVEEEFDIAYTGDTTVEALIEHADLWSVCHTIFCETTYLDANEKSRAMALNRGHMHVDDLVPLLNLAGKNQRLIVIHISGRYTAQQALEIIGHAIPSQFTNRVDVAASSLKGSFLLRNIARSGLVSLSAYKKQETKTLKNQMKKVPLGGNR